MDPRTKEGVLELMRTSQNEVQWDYNCDTVKAANGGYPDFWYATMILSGEADKILGKFFRDTKIRISSISPVIS